MGRAQDASQGSVRLVVEDRLGRIVLDRPNRRNALSLDMWRTIPLLVAQIEANGDIAAVLIEGAGDKAFAAGADITELEACLDSPEQGANYMAAIDNACVALASLSRPLIALVRGICTGAGIEIALTCDRRFAGPDSRFGVPPAKLGLTYCLRSTARLINLVGGPIARDLLFTARELTAEEALTCGLIDEIVDRERIGAVVADYAARIARLSPHSIRTTKSIIVSIESEGLTEPDVVRQWRVNAFSAADFREGVAAFRERRKPAFRLIPN